ncbi:MAG TPA: sigma 54-interacting transcriptional regulator [Phycisphaerae bacterium]|nr:sigma 54-interacting transcriptional regulator [Phycisphaerae bacterium]
MERAELELSLLNEISRALGSTLDLHAVFEQTMRVLAQKLGMERGSLVLLDEPTGKIRIETAMGLTPEEIHRGTYALGEGITGTVVATGQSIVVPDLAADDRFLNRTGARSITGGGGGGAGAGGAVQTSFICVPIRTEGRTVGAISVDKPYKDADTLRSDQRLLEIIASFIAQALKINEIVAQEREEWQEEKRSMSANLRAKYKFDNIIGSAPAMLDVFDTIAQVASSRATCLILGETGTGKELIAKAIHYNSNRADKPFIRVNCGALTGTLLESELFGHVKGSFTGAIKDKMGRFEAANGGTLFLDEIGTIDTGLQVKLLRVLQEREFERVGDNRTMKVDVRIIAATNLDLQEEVGKGRFREDLFYRLNVVTIFLPPLRNRREDIPRLIDFFLDKFNAENAKGLRKISKEMLNVLVRYPWPGNVRELENAMERAVVLSRGDTLSEDLLPTAIRAFAQQGRANVASEGIDALTRRLAEQSINEFELREGQIYDMVIRQVEKALIEKALGRCSGVKIKAADFLGINRNTLNKKFKELGLEAEELAAENAAPSASAPHTPAPPARAM